MTSRTDAGTRAKARWWQFRSLRSRPRLTVAALIFAAMLSLLLGLHRPAAVALLLSFDLAALIYLGSLAALFHRATPRDMRRLARQQDTGRQGTLWSGVVLSMVVMVALGLELRAGKGGGVFPIVVAAASILLSWLFMNVQFAMHYAHDYYGDYGSKESGLDFPGTKEPDYWDFSYFAMVLGMTFQVSDVQITDRRLRRLALVHSVIAFFFNVFIIALSVNVVAGQA
jgi:uncharacterized membrane protein